MLPFAPAIVVRVLGPDDMDAACVLLNHREYQPLYSRAMAQEEVSQQLLGDAPPTLLPVRWQQRAWPSRACSGRCGLRSPAG